MNGGVRQRELQRPRGDLVDGDHDDRSPMERRRHGRTSPAANGGREETGLPLTGRRHRADV
jgi:hypothetical protein